MPCLHCVGWPPALDLHVVNSAPFGVVGGLCIVGECPSGSGGYRTIVQFVVDDWRLARKAKEEAPLWAELLLFSLPQKVPIGQLASESNNLSPGEDISKHTFISTFNIWQKRGSFVEG